MNIPITQSAEWKDLQEALGEVSFLEHGKDYHYLAILKSTPVGKYLYLPYGPVYQGQSGRSAALKSLASLALKHQAIFTRIEPQDPDFKQNLPSNARKSTDLNPAETWVLDLSGTEDDLRARLPSRLLRYYRAAAKKGITVETSHNPADIHYLLDLQKQLAKEKGISTFSEKYLQTELSQPFATLYLAKQKQTDSSETILAAGLVFDDRTTRYNLQGAQSDEGRKLHATGILTIQLILDAYKKGLKTFDFWGIAPEGAPASHPWAGFTNFKKTFAGHEVTYAGTYDLIYNPLKYRLYQTIRFVNRLVRKTKLG